MPTSNTPTMKSKGRRAIRPVVSAPMMAPGMVAIERSMPEP